uniref:DDE Tnp4 domain-containing protein n=1 Tax=Oryza glumipatula TaxID=40148 RepID=A0A0D9ZV12_9ORYZ
MLGACCVLHNLCERSGEQLDADLLHDELVDDGVVAGGGNTVRSAAAEQIERGVRSEDGGGPRRPVHGGRRLAGLSHEDGSGRCGGRPWWSAMT